MKKLQFLGPATIHKEDAGLPKGSKRVALLAYLVLAKPRGYHRRDKLVALLWPEAGQKSARNSLSNILYHLRDAIGKDIILNRGSEEICVNSDKIWCDVWAFEKAIGQGKLDKAFQLYNSELLFGFHINHVSNKYQDWLDRERHRLQKSYIRLCWDLANKKKDVNNFEDAQRYALKAAELTPYSKKHQSRYIELLAEIGKPEEARRAYDRYVERLKTELNTDPSPDLRRYVQNLDAQQSNSTSAEKVKESGITKQYSSLEPNSQTNRKNSDKNSRNQPADRHKTYPNRLSTAIIRNIFILIIFVLSLWYIGRNFFYNETDILSSNNSVAVLPFTYINAPDSTDYFSLGMTEEILSKLAGVGNLSVTSRTSVMQYQNSEKSLREIAGELGVSSVVEGSVQRHKDRVRVTAQLIDAETDRHLWGETYDRQFEDILDIQHDIASRIAVALHTELLPINNSSYNPQQNVDELAYQKYLQAKYLKSTGVAKNIVKSVDILKESISIDTTFAPAYGHLALAYLYSGYIYRNLSRFPQVVLGTLKKDLEDAFNLALEASNIALSIDPNVVEAYLAQARIYKNRDKNWNKSEEKFLKALSLNPNHSDVLREYSALLKKLGNIEEALIYTEKAVAVNPLAWATHHDLGATYYHFKRYDEAIRELETSIDLGSSFPATKGFLCLALLKKSQKLFKNGQDEKAMALIDENSSIFNEAWGTSNTVWKESIKFALAGDKQKTLQSIEENSLPFHIKLKSLLLVGQKEMALQMIAQRIDFSRRAYIDPIFDTVREESRFQQQVERDLNKDVEFD